MIRKAIFLLLLSMMSVVIGQSTSDLTTGGVTMPADSGTSFLRSGLGVLFLTLAVPLLHLLR